ncbi:MAG TPA: amidohydrolase [Cytophagales bacterium]|nr:amidohydrolase [Cytophagales bacterium]
MNPSVLNLRKTLHQNPELSGSEVHTAARIKSFIDTHHPAQYIEQVGGQGLMAIYEYALPGKTIVIRCELDALPIAEQNTFSHRSNVNGIAHKCGHDGHMAIVAGLIFWIKEQTFSSGKIVLLFQPAEETGKGAYEVMKDARFQILNPDYVFALHNIPGMPLNSIITMRQGFSAEVQSFAVYFKGKEAHAAEPENGINPARGIAALISELSQQNIPDPSREDMTILTPIHILMGEKAYGVSPARGELHYTLRTWNEGVMKKVKQHIEATIQKIAHAHGLQYEMDWFEYFPSSINNALCHKMIIEAARANQLELIERPYPFKFGEDFGWYSKQYKTAMFGLGAGIHSPALHHADYDFPDEIMAAGVVMFAGIISSALESE